MSSLDFVPSFFRWHGPVGASSSFHWDSLQPSVKLQVWGSTPLNLRPWFSDGKMLIANSRSGKSCNLRWRSSSIKGCCSGVRGKGNSPDPSVNLDKVDQGAVSSDVETKLIRYGWDRVEPEGEVLNLLVNLISNPQLWLEALGSDQNEFGDNFSYIHCQCIVRTACHCQTVSQLLCDRRFFFLSLWSFQDHSSLMLLISIILHWH